jgi:hypothetical protein
MEYNFPFKSPQIHYSKNLLAKPLQTKRKRGEEMLKDVSTKELVEELKTREGVSAKIAEPYQDLSVKVNGPAIVMVIID